MTGFSSLILASTAEATEKGMAASLGVYWERILAQVLLFLIVYFILKKFAFGPIMAILEDRKQRIAEGEENLKKIAADLEAAEAKQAEIVSGANAKADKMISEARESADSLGEKKRVEATNEAASIVAKAREAGDLERSQILTELKRDFGRLVIDTTGKVTGKVLTSEDQDKINQETAGQLSL
jgi:F-type H+-transporting ATPase subunit b